MVGTLPLPAGHDRFFTPAPRDGQPEVTELTPEIQTQLSSRHRVHRSQALTPPGYYDTDFPSEETGRQWDREAAERKEQKRFGAPLRHGTPLEAAGRSKYTCVFPECSHIELRPLAKYIEHLCSQHGVDLCSHSTCRNLLQGRFLTRGYPNDIVPCCNKYPPYRSRLSIIPKCPYPDCGEEFTDRSGLREHLLSHLV